MATRRKARTKKDDTLVFLKDSIANNTRAIQEGPRVKNFTLHNLKTIHPLTYGQKQLFESYFSGNNVVANGSAGTGKSYCAVFMALNDVLREDAEQKEIIIVRSAVQTRQIGMLPGELGEKIAPFEEPYKDIFADLLKKHDAYDTMKESGKLRFMVTSFVRGLTWDNAIIIIDEAQSLSFHELNSVLTRLGDNSRLIVCGDINQNDLITNKYDQSGYPRMLSAMAKMESVDIVTFTKEDIVRSSFVREWICAVEETA